MATNLRVTGTHAYQAYREVEPVPPYPRIDPQRPRDEYPQQQSDQRADKADPVRRRFMAMRILIDELKKAAGLTRVDYVTAETELNDLGLSILESELVEQLLELKVSLEGIDHLFQQIRQRPTTPDLKAGHNLSEAYNFFPVFIAGISEYNLRFQQLQVQSSDKSIRINESIDSLGHFVSEKNRLRLDFRKMTSGEDIDVLQLDISVQVAVSEVDDAGRRVILYQRPNQSYALYADKQIDLSI
ncbi:MAG: hypothetical protein GQ563_00245 [Desulfuromusa sp.]|nr:hypothetical protein [Desulfuromusa sp.]